MFSHLYKIYRSLQSATISHITSICKILSATLRSLKVSSKVTIMLKVLDYGNWFPQYEIYRFPVDSSTGFQLRKT